MKALFSKGILHPGYNTSYQLLSTCCVPDTLLRISLYYLTIMTAFQIDLFLVEKLRIPVYHLSI